MPSDCSHIKVVPAGMSRSIKKLVKTQIPDLHKYKDIADFVMRSDIVYILCVQVG